MLALGLLDLQIAQALRMAYPSHWMVVPSGFLFLVLFTLPILLGRSRESALAHALLGRSLQKIGLGKLG